MKHFISLCFTLIFLNLSGQSKWSVGRIVGADMTSVMKHQILYFCSFGAQGSSNFDFRRNSRIGFNLEYRLNEEISFKSGLRMNNQGVWVVKAAEAIDSQIITYDATGRIVLADLNMPVEFEKVICESSTIFRNSITSKIT